MSLRLRIEHGQDAGHTWRLPSEGVYTVGRMTDISIRVLDMKVSKHHCEISVVGSGAAMKATLHDLGSTHGCQLNGQPVRKDVPLKPGDELRLGMTILRVLSEGEANADAMPASGRHVDEARNREAASGSHPAAATKQTLPPDALVGRELAGYKIESKIGAGGMGGVYLAEQISLQRKVALKVLNERFASDSAFVDQFVNEARAAGALNHPNVVQVYDVGNAEGHYFFSMEVMPGGSIEDRVKEGKIEWATGLNWFIDSANALIFAKRREILHRDVKPDNLMIAEDESSKLCDLGLAKKSEVRDLMDQGIIGTPHFISPEAIRRKGDIDHRTDLYSLGCTFYRIFSGKNPFPGTTVKDILLGHLNSPVPRVNAVNREVPRELDEIVFKLMQKDPEERYQSPEELLRALDKIRTQYNLEAHGIKPSSRKPLIIGAVAALIAIGLGIFILTREPEVVIIPQTIEQKEAAARAAREAVRGGLETYVNAAASRWNELNGEYISNDLKGMDQAGKGNWKKSLWPRLSKDLERTAADWNRQIETWKTEAAAQEDRENQQSYQDSIAALGVHAKNATVLATSITTDIKYRRDNEKKIATEFKAAVLQIDTDIKGYTEKLKGLLESRKFLELETSLTRDELGKIVAALLAKKVGDIQLLDLAKHVKPVLDKQMPADKEGKNRGQKLITGPKGALKQIELAANKAVSDAAAARQADPGHKGNLAFVKACNAWLATLPPEPWADTAPRVAAALKRARAKVEKARDSVLFADDLLTAKELKEDRARYFTLVKRLWAPLDAGGLLQRFELKAARDEVKMTQQDMKHEDYQRLMLGWAPPVEALAALFEHAIASYPAGWVSIKFEYVNEKGKTKKDKIKGVDENGVLWGKTVHPFAKLGPRWLLDRLFFFEGKPRMKTCTPQDHHGLAVLAELAGDYDLAIKQYKAARAQYGKDPLEEVIFKRLGKLGLERQAAEKWAAAVKLEREIALWRDGYVEKVRKANAEKDPDAFSKEDRAAVLSDEVRIAKMLQEARGMADELNDQADLAGTFWGSAIREKAHPEVAYAGETLHKRKPNKPAPNKPAPNKPGPNKPGDDKPGDEKGAEDTGPKDEPGSPKKNGDGK